MIESYFTIESESHGVYKEKGSKFFAYAYPVSSELEVKEIVKSLRKEYYDARHHCYAYVLGADGEQFRAADDGEPSNSAGNPILGQIRTRELRNVLVVVVRYFGGTKLGVPGLIHAYKASSADALDNAVVVTREVMLPLILAFDYLKMNDVMRVVKELNLDVKAQEYTDLCLIYLDVKIAFFDRALEALQELGKVQE